MPQNRQVTLVLDTTNPHQRKIAQGVATYAHGQSNWILHVVQDPLENLPYVTLDPLETPYDLRAWRPDGIIGHFCSQKVLAAAHRLNIPMVGIEGEYGLSAPKWDVPCFDTDNDAIGRLGATEFIERGMKHLAFCGVPHMQRTGWSEQRQLAFETRAREAGIPCSVFVGGDARTGNVAKLHRELAAWLSSLPKPVGLMASYDVRARHVLTACRSLGLLVPEDVAVIGVDNYELICELTNPPLSSIEQGARTMGYQAAALLDRLMAGEKAPQLKFVVEPEGIITRQSSDALAIDDTDVAATLRFIRQHACEGIHVSDVVRAVAISRSALDARFKSVTGRTIHAEIQRVRIERARQLAAATDLPLGRVAAIAGFRYLQQMTTAFRLHTGQTPSEYRRRSRL